MAQTKATQLTPKDSILKSYRQTEVEIEGVDTLSIRYKAPSTRAIFKMQELAAIAKEKGEDAAALESWNRLADLVSEHLVDEQGAPLCTTEELMDAPLDFLLALGQAITSAIKGEAAEVAAQGEG